MQGVLLLVLMMLTVTQASPAEVLNPGSGGPGESLGPINPGCTTGDCLPSKHWEGPLSTIWTTDQCSPVQRGPQTLEDCQSLCLTAPGGGCNAINYKGGSGGTATNCIILYCDSPPPSGLKTETGWLGYKYVDVPPPPPVLRWYGPKDNIWASSQCSLTHKGAMSLASCQSEALLADFNAINYKGQNVVNSTSDCVLVNCPSTIPAPGLRRTPYLGYEYAIQSGSPSA